MQHYLSKVKNFFAHQTTAQRILIFFFVVSIGVTTTATIYFSQTTNKRASAATTFVMGTDTIGTTTDAGDGNSVTCNRYTAENSGTMTSMSVFVAEVDPNNSAYSLALYADAANNPTDLITSATGNLTANNWNSLSITAPVIGGNAYWLCYNANTLNNNYNNMKYAAGSAPAIYKAQLYGTWPNPFGTVGGRWTDNYSIHATVAIAVETTPTVIPTTTATPTAMNTGIPSEAPTTIVLPTTAATPTPAPSVTPMKIISRSVPAFASAGTASSANDASYNTVWRSGVASAWLAYNLASVPVANRGKVLLAWYNEATDAYDPALAYETPIGYPKDYTIQTNTAPSATTAPTSGWVTKVTVNNNKYHSRQHAFDMTGANWVRINVSTVNGGPQSRINMDVYDNTNGPTDDWIIYGSSTPSMAMNHNTVGSTTLSFSQMINQAKPNYFPIQENGAISGLNSTEGAQYLPTWLALFPGRYVGLGFGANDADQCMNPTTFYNNYVSMVQTIIAAGKVPVVPIFNWSKMPNVQNCGPALVEKINLLYTNYPQVVKGPDFWTYYKDHPELISSDNQHPTTEGLGQYRALWAQSALTNIYK